MLWRTLWFLGLTCYWVSEHTCGLSWQSREIHQVRQHCRSLNGLSWHIEFLGSVVWIRNFNLINISMKSWSVWLVRRVIDIVSGRMSGVSRVVAEVWSRLGLNERSVVAFLLHFANFWWGLHRIVRRLVGVIGVWHQAQVRQPTAGP